MSTDPHHAVQQWIDGDVDEGDRAELRTLLDQARDGSARAGAELTDRMSAPLAFGTAGLRGPLRAGPNGMNRAVVIRTTAGLGAWLVSRGHRGGIVVIGRDARHGSHAFATDAAEVLAAAGFDVRALPEPLPTPVLAHATRALGAVAGIQVTASHNPPRDNGYKVYLDGGAQLIGPADTEIEAAITEVGPANLVPRSSDFSIEHDAAARYLERVVTLPRGTARELRVAATALHGVGAATLEKALRGAGFTDLHLVASQAEPDPDFPTVRFPNPEEPGAADAVLALAEQVDADLVIALDPDADRCAVGARESDGTWRMLRGDETGVLLGHHVLSTMDNPAGALVATTIVSATMLAPIAESFGARGAETLTGFKWLVRAGEGLVYAYEEAIGHCVDPDAVRDKDGISAAVLACDLAATRKAAGATPFDALDALSSEHGVHLTDQISVRVTDLDQISRTMRAVRDDPPTELGGVAVRCDDLLPRTDALIFRGSGVRVVLRPSGTEPKLKCYLQAVSEVTDELRTARRAAGDQLAALRHAVSALVRDAPEATHGD